MKLQDCHMQLRTVLTAPLERDEPEPEWSNAHESEIIPEQLWNLYRSTRYLSGSALAGMETPQARMITVYVARLMRSVRECLVDASELREQMRQLSPLQYDPRKPYPHEFDREASRRHRSAFRSLLVNLLGSLDVFADLVAIILPRRVPRLAAGRATFTDMERWLAKPNQVTAAVVTPHEHHASELHNRLSPLIFVVSGPERDWLPLLRMYRNKVAHLGHESYTQFGLEHISDDGLSFFIPRSWPFVAEQYASSEVSPTPSGRLVDFSDVLTRWLMHQDLEEYSEGAIRKVREVLGVGFQVLHEAYVQLKSISPSQQVLEDLESSKQSFEFEYFHSAG